MGLVPHLLYGQLMWGLYIKWALSPTRLVFWVEFSCLVCNIGITVSEPELGIVAWRASRDQRGRDQRGRDQRGSEWWPMEWWPGKSQP
ncbi:hypothetical protein Hanom_Chr04g00306101 [Helianthus anomalus]